MVVELGLKSATAAIDLYAMTVSGSRLDISPVGEGDCCVVTIPADN